MLCAQLQATFAACGSSLCASIKVDGVDVGALQKRGKTLGYINTVIAGLEEAAPRLARQHRDLYHMRFSAARVSN
jgi:hypothetical protein